MGAGGRLAAAVRAPIEPMLAKLAAALPDGGAWLFEPKWDGFRALVFRDGAGVFLQSRDLRPLDRYFPELHEALLARLPAGCVVDGEIAGLDGGVLQHVGVTSAFTMAVRRQLARELEPLRRNAMEGRQQ